MKDLLIPGRILARELRVALACLGLALALNAYAIVRFETSWTELCTTLPLTLAIALVLYFLLGTGRLLIAGVRRLARRRRTDPT